MNKKAIVDLYNTTTSNIMSSKDKQVGHSQTKIQSLHMSVGKISQSLLLLQILFSENCLIYIKHILIKRYCGWQHPLVPGQVALVPVHLFPWLQKVVAQFLLLGDLSALCVQINTLLFKQGPQQSILCLQVKNLLF